MADTDQIKVVVRVRPLIQREQQAGQDARWTVKDEKVISQRDQPSLPAYTFDQVYDRDCSTWELYSGAIAPIVEAAMNGYHGTLFAYGQSGSGKTYTMSGDKMTPGIIAQAMNDIFDFIEQKPSHEFLMRASYMEIYNEKIYDLLSKEERNLKIIETPDHQINVVGLEEELVHSCEHVLSVIQKGEAKRKFAETKQNDRSSRSHCIFRIIVESRKRNETDAAVMVSHLNFVDLAGSEKAGENSGDRFREGCSINMSLFCLSNVISKLSEGVGKQFIGYRDSKLTRILQNALGGNSKTVIVATINPTTIEESHSTLRFATRAKTIKNKAHVNEVLSDAALLKKYRNQISDLEKLVKDMGVADIQSANEDLKKKLDEKQSLIDQLTKQIVVSSISMTEKTTVQKKKMRRETWCAPKVRRKSYFPSLTPVNHPSVTIREETDLDLDLARGDDLSLPFTSITVTANDETKTKAFLRRSEEMALSDSLLSVAAGVETSGVTMFGEGEGEVERLREVVAAMTAQHAQELERLQDQIKQLQYEKAVDLDLSEEQKKNMVAGQQEVTTLKESIARMEYEAQLHVEENQLLQKNLWHAEEDIKRLKEETSHLCDKRFDFTLKEWEELQAAKVSLETEIKGLVASLQQKDKDIEELQKALSGQEPYIARMEQQLEMYMGAGNGQLGSGGGNKRRSGIPVLVKSEEKNSPDPLKAEKEDKKSAASESGLLKVSRPEMVDCATSTGDLPQTSTSHTPEVAVVSPQLPSQSGCELSSGSFLEPTAALDSTTSPDRSRAGQDLNADTCSKWEPCNISVSSSIQGDMFSSQGRDRVQSEKEKEMETMTPERGEVPKTILNSTENSAARRAMHLKRRSDVVAVLPDGNAELTAKLRERDQELEQLASEHTRLLEVLNQANAEIVRYKEAMEAMEQADAERMEELSEMPKLRALLNRRDMEIHRLETLNDRLKEDLNQQMLNSSVSSLSSSFTEPRRKSAMLKEREAEIWKLKDQLIQQAKRLDDVQQEKVQLEDMVMDLQTQPEGEYSEQGNASDKDRSSSSSSADSSSAPSASEVNTSVREEEEMERETEEVMVTVAEMEAVQRMLCDKDSMISRLKTQLQEKEEEMEQMFEGQMLVSSDMIQTHLQQAEQQKDQIEELQGQLKSREEEIAKFKARAELQHSSSGSSSSNQGEESAFLEQLIMDKMALEENLQEKASELMQAADESKELQAQLDERRAIINQLRQQYEETTEALLSTQEELIALKMSVENEEAKKAVSQSAEQPSAEKEEPTVKGEDSFEVSFKTQSVGYSDEVPCEEPAVKGEDSFEVSFKTQPGHSVEVPCEEPAGAEDSFEVSFKTQSAGHSDEAPCEEHARGEDSSEVSFKTTGAEIRDGEGENISHLASGLSEPSKTVQEDDSFEVSFKTTNAEAAVSTDDHLTQRIKFLEQRETKLLDLLQEKEEQIKSLTVQKEQSQASCAADFEEVSKSSVAGDITPELPSHAADLNAESTELPLEKQCEALMEQKANLQNRLQEAEAVVEEKTILEAKMQELLKVVDEKSSVISQLQKQHEEMRVQSETKSMEGDPCEAGVEEAAKVWAAEKETLLARLSHLNHVEQCLETNIKMLEQSQEEKAALDKKVKDLEATLEQLAGSREMESTEKEKTTELESLLSEMQQIRSENDRIVSQTAELENEIQDLKAKEKVLQKDVQQTEETKAHLAEALEQCGALETKADGLSAKIEELTKALEQMTSEHEEVNDELTWQTKENERLQNRVEELETELEEQKQEAEDLVQELEKVQKLQEDSEHCQKVVEDTLENFKSQNAKLEADKHTLATERDEFELRAEAAVKEQERLQLELRVTGDRLQNRISALELEQQNTEQRKQVLEAALADKESVQRMGELLHDKLSVDLQESQAEVSTMKTTLSQLQFELQNQESKFSTLKKITASLEAEKDELAKDKSNLEKEQLELKKITASLEAEKDKMAQEKSSLEKEQLELKKITASLEAEKDQAAQEKSSLEKEQLELKKITASLEAEKDHLAQEKSSLEKERQELKARLSGLEDQVHALQKDLDSKQAIEETKQALEMEVHGHRTELEQLRNQVHQLGQQVEAGRQKTAQLQKERDETRDTCQDTSHKLSLLEAQCRTGQTGVSAVDPHHAAAAEGTCYLFGLWAAGEESEKRAASAMSECSRLQDELGSKLEHIEHLEKELEATKASGESSSASEKMIPLIEVKKQKFVLKNKIAYLTRELESMKKAASCKDNWIQELHEKLSKYENEEQEDKEEKIEKLEEAIKTLEDSLKAKDMELVGLKMQQQDAVGKLNKRLSNAEEMVTYKEQIISKLKGEIRRIRSEEVSFCSSAAPKSKAPAPEPVRSAHDERVISSHSGIIDRYTVTLLEADKYKLQKELKKTQDRLQCRESELHLAKVALAKSKAGSVSSPPTPSSAVGSRIGSDIRVERKSGPALQRESSGGALVTPSAHPAGGVTGEQRSPLLERLGTSVDGGLMVRDSESTGTGDSMLRSTSAVSTAPSGPVPRIGGRDSVSRSWKQEEARFGSLPSGGTSVDLKKDRPVLPSAVDKENTPLGTDVLAAHKTPTDSAVQDVTDAESPIHIEPEFWKKPKRPASTYRSSTRMLGKSAAAGADQCKTH
ncbi:uncharacterized protein LOC143288036 [Babylonia areolata]|uniref:uncharacterized protein LOC143288036 n=1 Tax=Babylonia areolata TaxID=304850 RepID=UPI003FCF14B7